MDKSFVERTMSELRMGEVDEEGKYRGRSIEEVRMIEWMEDSNREGTLSGERVSTTEEKKRLQTVQRNGRKRNLWMKVTKRGPCLSRGGEVFLTNNKEERGVAELQS